MSERSPNRLLAALPRAEYEHLHARMEVVRPRLQEVLYEQGGRMEHVFFPESGTMSLLAVMADDEAVEVGTVGNEGMVGVSVALGGEKSPHRVTAQIPGRTLRMPAADFRALVPPEHPLHGIVRRYVDAFMMQVSQSVACNRVHDVAQRLARWLCITHDRVRSDEFPLTQEVIAQMLGVRRQTVSEVASEFQTAQLIEYRLGRVTVLNRAALERAACECYRTVRAHFDRMIGVARG
ncbi:MAG: Crp/Fnr family transcriptional regulator [Gemmatimonadaceae bacterium]